MDTSTHNLGALFEQLGLSGQEADIQQFIHQHKLPPETPLAEAPFWNHAQATFLQEGILDDSDWAETIDTLDAMLRKK